MELPEIEFNIVNKPLELKQTYFINNDMKTEFKQGQLEAVNTMILDIKGRINVYKNIGVENDPEAIEKSKKRSERIGELNSILSRLLRYKKVINKR